MPSTYDGHPPDESGPADIVTEFFQAVEERRWTDAARLFHPELIADLARLSLDRIARMEQEPDRTVEDLVKSFPDMPREVAQFTVERDPYRKLTVAERIEQEFHGYRTNAAAQKATAVDLLAAHLEAHDVRTRSRRTIKAAASSPWAQNVLRVGLLRKVIGEVREIFYLVYVLFREAVGEHPTPENSFGLRIVTLARAERGWRIIDDSIIASKVYLVGVEDGHPVLGSWK